MPSNKTLICCLCVISIPGLILSSIIFGFSIYGTENIPDKILPCELNCTVIKLSDNICSIELSSNNTEFQPCSYDGNCDSAPFSIPCEIKERSNGMFCPTTNCGTEEVISKTLSFAGAAIGAFGLLIFITLLIVAGCIIFILICK